MLPFPASAHRRTSAAFPSELLSANGNSSLLSSGCVLFLLIAFSILTSSNHRICNMACFVNHNFPTSVCGQLPISILTFNWVVDWVADWVVDWVANGVP